MEITCSECGWVYSVDVTHNEVMAWRNGAKTVQEMFPHLSSADRELLITSICGICFDDLFAYDEEWHDEEE